MTVDETPKAPVSEEASAKLPLGRKTKVTAGAVTLCLLVASGGIWWKVMEERSDLARTTDALATAETMIVPLLSYSHESVEEQLTEALTNVSGSFADDYGKLVTEIIVPESRERELDTEAVVIQSGVVDATDRHVTVLLFVDQSTTAADSPGARRDVSRIQVTLEDEGEQWTITNLEAV